MKQSQVLGKEGEFLAKKHLLNLGYTILEENFFALGGEIDLIASKNECLFFCEVKTRSTHRFGKGYEAVSGIKIQKIKKVAEKYLVDINWTGQVQILILSIFYQSKTSYKIELIEYF